jgi:hypothetical protein
LTARGIPAFSALHAKRRAGPHNVVGQIDTSDFGVDLAYSRDLDFGTSMLRASGSCQIAFLDVAIVTFKLFRSLTMAWIAVRKFTRQ